MYLNVIEWGGTVWGAEAASRRYFHKSASDLSAAESALLAGAISNPRTFDPAHPSAHYDSHGAQHLQQQHQPNSQHEYEEYLYHQHQLQLEQEKELTAAELQKQQRLESYKLEAETRVNELEHANSRPLGR